MTLAGSFRNKTVCTMNKPLKHDGGRCVLGQQARAGATKDQGDCSSHGFSRKARLNGLVTVSRRLSLDQPYVRCRLLPAEHTAGGPGRPKRRCVTEVTSRYQPLQYCLTRMWIEEVAMTAAVKRTGTRLVRWFEEFRRKNRPPYKWYEHDLYGGLIEPPTIATRLSNPSQAGFSLVKSAGAARRTKRPGE